MPGGSDPDLTYDDPGKPTALTDVPAQYQGSEDADLSVSGTGASPATGTSAPDAATDEANAQPAGIGLGTHTLSSDHKTAVRGSSIEAYGSTKLSLSSGWWAYADFSSTTAHARWWGASPINANQIAGSATWSVSGATVSVGIPPGISFSGTGSSVTWRPGGSTNTWHQDLTYNPKITEKALILFSEHYSTHADVLLGSSWYGV